MSTTATELQLCEALRAGDQSAFAELVDRYQSSLFRVAMGYVRNPSVAEEVVQETWLGVINGLHRFENRSSLKTWIFRILTNTAKTRAERERRAVPFSSLARPGEEEEGPSVDGGRFADGWWASSPTRWDAVPEGRLLSGETLGVVAGAIDALPEAQRRVIVLRDVEGWESEDVCAFLDLSEGNQRVLLHRARSKVRAALERYFDAANAV